MYDTNEHLHVCVPWSKLVQHKVVLAEFRVGEDCNFNVIDRLQAGQSQTEVAKHFNVHQSTI
jgi:hypothetical protein